MDKNYIVIYAEDFDSDIWERYCEIAGVPKSATEITLFFNPNNVKYVIDE